MKTWEAIRLAMEEGKKIRVVNWARDEYICQNADGLLQFYNESCKRGCNVALTGFSQTWELYREKVRGVEAVKLLLDGKTLVDELGTQYRLVGKHIQDKMRGDATFRYHTECRLDFLLGHAFYLED